MFILIWCVTCASNSCNFACVHVQCMILICLCSDSKYIKFAYIHLLPKPGSIQTGDHRLNGITYNVNKCYMLYRKKLRKKFKINEIDKRTNNDLQKLHIKLKISNTNREGELLCTGRISSFSSNTETWHAIIFNYIKYVSQFTHVMSTYNYIKLTIIDCITTR